MSNAAEQRIDSSLTVRELMRQYGIADALTRNITEFAINEPGAFWIEDASGWQKIDNPLLTLPRLQGLATAIAVLNHKRLDRDNPHRIADASRR